MAQIKDTTLAKEGAEMTKPAPAVRKSRSAGLTVYLFLYNLISSLLWLYPLTITILYLLNIHPSTYLPPNSPLLPYLPVYPNVRSYPTLKYAKLFPSTVWPYLYRAATIHSVIGEETKWIQSLALLEVVHSALGWVRSPLFTSASQVASRIVLVWGIAPRFAQAQNNPIYATMVIAWGITETIRYGYYAFNVLGFEPYPLLWLRYTTFYILYPLGAGSEAFVMFSTLPISLWPKTEIDWSVWTGEDYLRGFLFCFWWPALAYLYMYMIGQRRKVLGNKGRSVSSQQKKKTQ